ncbi:DUF1846 domain-containing protein [uncultured Faecalibaculum sp.]|uniref:DUF1846 domain-containing protein n=1 Tax=uncultured Faecalibaculum sp. TaxID=1729681 RepID=UPI0025CD789D|nr:DUF1846 domain-containing protein [uncultured Faecalibaculum sp.]
MKSGFDNDKYLKMQSEHIRERIGKFGDKLYLEFGGKLFDDYHASRVLPGFAPDSKLQMLLQLKDQAEIVAVINAEHIAANKVRQDLGITYQEDVLRLIDEFRQAGLYVGSVVLTHTSDKEIASGLKAELEKKGIPLYYHYRIAGYPTDTDHILSEDGFGRNDYIETSRPLVVVTAPGPGSGKMATCLSQLYHENRRGIKAGYAKYETFPVWNLPLNHPVNLAYESATADLNDVNMIDPWHQQAYGEITVNYNRDVEIYPVLRQMFCEIYGSSPYASPTDMGVNMAGFCIEDEEAVSQAAKQEIIRRYFFTRNRVIDKLCDPQELKKQEMVMKQAGVTVNDRRVFERARGLNEETGDFAAALEFEDGTIVTGKNSELMGPASAMIMNALKYSAGIDPQRHLIDPEDFAPIQRLKISYFGNQNPRLHTNEMLIALSMTARSNPEARRALEQLPALAGAQSHITSALSEVDQSVLSSLKIQTTFEADKV